MSDKKLINENTSIEISEDGNTVVFTNVGEDGSIYTNTFYLTQKEEIKESEEDCLKE